MSAIIIKADSQSNKLLKELAKKLGASVISLDESQYEDFMLGTKMDSEKTNEMVSRESIMQKLKGK
jgi:tRNA A37 N6-isopentenylltransferase MiaA